MANNHLNVILEELERRRQSRQLNARLRDASNPFEVPENEFRKSYRLDHQAALDLFNLIEPHIADGQRLTKIPKVVKFVAVMHFFAYGSYQKSVGKDHYCGLSQTSVSRCLTEIADIIIAHVAPTYINFPENLREITTVKNGFFEKFNFPGITGCIDCTHIAIVPPPANDIDNPAHAFMNRKGFYSINCQIICDANLKILAINARYPGSVHDSATWMVSNIKEVLQRNFMENHDRTTWLLGDSGYPLQPYLLTPIVGAHRDTPEGRYTRQHCVVRNSIKRCIGLLKAYFRCLHKDRVLHYSPQMAAKIIYCCAVLHNILRVRNIDDADINIEYEYENDNEREEGNEVQQDLFREGRAVRNDLINNIFA